MRYFFLAAALTMAMLAGPAYAQKDSANKTPLELQYEREKQQQIENERAYNETMKRLKSQAPTSPRNDPWKGVRSTTDSAKR